MADLSRYNNQDRESLIKKIEELENIIAEFQKEREVEDMLNFGWAGNLGRWLWHVDSNTVIFNPLKVTTLGYSLDEIPENVGYQFFTEKLHPEDYPKTMEAMMKHLMGEKNVYETEYRIKTKNDGWKWFYDIGKITKYDNAGKPLVVTGIVFDISERKQTEEKLQASINELKNSNMAKNKLFSIIAHDLRNPFNTVLGFTDTLSEMFKEKDYEEMGNIINSLNQSAIREYELLQNLLMWSKSQLEGFRPAMTEVKIKEIINKETDLMSAFAARKNITIINEIGDNVLAQADENMASIIIRNLISNAIKFSKESGNININSTIKNNFLVVSISDNGNGIEPTKAAKLFSTTINNSTEGSGHEKGSGLGLMLCKELVANNGGEIWVDNNPEGGSIFRFTLPSVR